MRRLLRPTIILPLLVGASLLAALLAFADVKKVVALLTAFDNVYLIYYLVLMAAYTAVRGMQWHELLAALEIDAPLRSQMFAFLVGEVTKSIPIGNYVQNYILLREAATLIEQGKAPEALALQEQAAALLHAPIKTEAPITREATASPRARPNRADVLGTIGRSTRQDVVDALNDLGVPSSPRAIADYARARFGTKLESRLFASLRRDERRTWESPRSHRPVYVVPALSAASPGRLLAVRGKLALSDWPLEVRLIGPWSERVDHLRATVNIARQVQWLRASKPEEADRVAAVLARFAATVPDATDSAAAVDPDRVIRAARAELELLGTADDEWRRETAAVAREAVALDEQLWGTRLPRLVGSSE